MAEANFRTHVRFSTSLSEKLQQILEKHQEDWEQQVMELEELRNEAAAGRKGSIEGLTKEASVFYDYVARLAYEDGIIPEEDAEALKLLMNKIVTLIRARIGVLDFWRKPNEVKRLRSDIDTEILLTDIPALTEKRERITVEIIKLAQNRHGELLR